MLDFYHNTYVVYKEEFSKVLEILKNHPEYKGFFSKYEFHDKYHLKLWELLEYHFDVYTVAYLDNQYLSVEKIAKNPDMKKITQVYNYKAVTQHEPKSLLTALMQLDKQVMRFD